MRRRLHFFYPFTLRVSNCQHIYWTTQSFRRTPSYTQTLTAHKESRYLICCIWKEQPRLCKKCLIVHNLHTSDMLGRENTRSGKFVRRVYGDWSYTWNSCRKNVESFGRNFSSDELNLFLFKVSFSFLIVPMVSTVTPPLFFWPRPPSHQRLHDIAPT